jgi:hypothetical protein
MYYRVTLKEKLKYFMIKLNEPDVNIIYYENESHFFPLYFLEVYLFFQFTVLILYKPVFKMISFFIDSICSCEIILQHLTLQIHIN